MTLIWSQVSRGAAADRVEENYHHDDGNVDDGDGTFSNYGDDNINQDDTMVIKMISNIMVVSHGDDHAHDIEIDFNLLLFFRY